MTNEELKAWRLRLSLGEAGMASYLGTPVTTYRKWENGTRSQDASTHRLFDILALVEQRMPDTHAELVELARKAEPVEKPKPVRKGRGKGVKVVHCRDLLPVPPAAPVLPDWLNSNPPR